MKSRPSSRRARTSIVWGVGMFIAVNLVANIWLPAAMNSWTDPVFYVRRDRLASRIDAHYTGPVTKRSPGMNESAGSPYVVAMFGSSRTMNGFDGREVEKVLQKQLGRPVIVANFGRAGASPSHMLMDLGRLLRDGPRPDLVLIETHPIFLRQTVDSTHLFRSIGAPTQADTAWLASYGLTIPAEFQPTDKQSSLAVWNCRKELIRAVFPRLHVGIDNTNWVTNDTDECGTLLQGDVAKDSPKRKYSLDRAYAEYHDAYRAYRVGGPGFHSVEAALRACHDHQVATALVVMPEGPEMRSWYRDGAREELTTKLAELSRRWDSRVIDSWDWLPELAFLDSHHLLSNGAKEFSDRLARESLAPLASESPRLAEQSGEPLPRNLQR